MLGAPMPSFGARNTPVERERLMGLIDDQPARLIVVHAPAGFGKTTLIEQWRKRLDEQEVLHATLSLFRSHDDASSLLSGLGAACQHALRSDPGAMGNPIQALARQSRRLVIFLDDIDRLTSEPALAAIRLLLSKISHAVQVVIAGRSIPTLGQARLRVADAVIDVNADDLRFRPAETAFYFSRRLGRPLTSVQLGNVQRRTEGWPAALQLARLSMREQHAIRLPVDFDRDFAAYLDEVVLDDLPMETRSFLTVTSILSRLTGALCDALTGRNDGDAMLDRLEKQGLFLKRIPSASGPAWYRYHPLFSEVLRQGLRSMRTEQSTALHEAACRWYLAEGLIADAAEHARAAGNDEQAFRLLDGIAMEHVWQGRVRTVLEWGTALTVEHALRYERLFVAYLWAEGFVGDRDKALRRLDEVATAINGRKTISSFLADTLVSLPIMIAAMAVDLAKMRRDGPDALLRLSSRSTFEYGTLATALAYTYLATGELDLAHRSLVDGSQPAHANFQTYNLAYTKWTEGHLYLCDLDTKQAIAALGYDYERVDADQNDYSQSNAITASLYADALYETGDLVGAQSVLDRYLPIIAETIPDCMITGYTTAAAIQMSEGDYRSAHDTLLEGEQHGFRRSSEFIVRSMRWRSAWLAAVTGAEKTALRLRNELAVAEAELDPHLMSVADTLTRDLYRIRLDIHLGRIEGLPAEIQRLSAEAEHRGLGRRQLRLDILGAAALKAMGSAHCVQVMTKALRLGVSHGFVQCFLDEGAEVIDLVQDARAGLADLPASVALTRLDIGLGLAKSSGRSLPLNDRARMLDDLTAREADIVAVLEKGLTNREIAECLSMSENTVKWHLQHIFQKLGVGNRTEAVFMFRSGDC